MPTITKHGNLWFVGERLVIPKVTQLREMIFRLTHNVLGHFGLDKSYMYMGRLLLAKHAT